MVFDMDQAPREPAPFMEWYDQLTRWNEGRDYNDPTETSPALQGWYRDMISGFPPMNGPDAVSEDRLDDSHVTDYSCARHAIYAAFAWSVVEEARRATFETARRHGLGFFDVSDDGGVWGPTTSGYSRLFVVDSND